MTVVAWIGWGVGSGSGSGDRSTPPPDDRRSSGRWGDGASSEPGDPAPPDRPSRPGHELVVVTTGLGGEPRPEVRVEAVLVPEGAAAHDAVPAFAEALTDLDGRARLILPEGRYVLRVFHPGWFASNVEVDVPARDPISIRLSPGIHLRVMVVDADGAPVEGAVLTERWLGTMRGAITGPDGIGDLGAVHPENAFVWVSKPGWLTNRAYFNRLGMKGDEFLGRLTIRRGGTLVVTAVEEATGALLGDVALFVDTKKWDRLTARTDAGGRAELPGVLVPPRIGVRGTLPDGRRARVTMEVSPGDGRREAVLLFPRGRTVSGIVVSSRTGEPVSGAGVYLEGASGDIRRRATTGPDGAFRFGPVPGDPGDDLDLHVEAAGLVMREEEAGEVEPGPGGAESLRIELVPTGTLEGRVRDQAGRAVPGVLVSVRENGGGSPRVGGGLEERTDAEGAYRIEGAPPRESVTVLVITDGRGIAWARDIAVKPGGTTRVPDIVLPGAFTFSARVVSEAGEPVARGWFWLRYRVKTEGMGAEWRVIRDGRFAEIRGIPRPGAVVELEGPGFLKTVLRVSPETTTLVMDRPLRAVGRAVGAEGGVPLAAALLVFTSRDRLSTLEGNSAQATTDAEGRFEVPGLRAGRYVVSPRGETVKAEVEIRRDGEDLGLVRFE